MRARAGDPPRTMAQKILAGRCADPTLSGDVVQVKVDQIVLVARASARDRRGTRGRPEEDLRGGGDRLRRPRGHRQPASRLHSEEMQAAAAEVLAHGIVIGRPGVGFPAPVHLERFASPARLCVTDEPRLASVGGIGMLTIVVSPGMLGQALAQGSIQHAPAAQRAGPPLRAHAPVRLRARRRARARSARPRRGRVAHRGRSTRRPSSSSSPVRARGSSRCPSAPSSPASRRSSAPPARSS